MIAARSVGLDVGAMSGFSNDIVDEEFFKGTSYDQISCVILAMQMKLLCFKNYRGFRLTKPAHICKELRGY